MPSLLEHLENDEPDHVPVSAPLGMIDAVKAEGARRRTFRHRRNLAGAVLALGLLALPAAALQAGGGGDEPGEVAVATDGGGTIPDIPADSIAPAIDPVPPGTVAQAQDPAPPPVPTLPTPTSTASNTSPSPTTAPPTTRRPVTPTTTPVPACRNSDNPDCGDFYWDPKPAPNQPLVASFVNPPTKVTAGEPVTFEVEWSDGDAVLTFDYISTDGSALSNACALMPRHGAWTPPPPEPGSGTLRYSETFQTPGAVVVIVSLGTSGCASPYSSDTQVTTTVTVE